MSDTFGMVAMSAARADAALVTVLSAKSNRYVHALRNTIKINGFAFDVDVVRGTVNDMKEKGKKVGTLSSLSYACQLARIWLNTCNSLLVVPAKWGTS